MNEMFFARQGMIAALRAAAEAGIKVAEVAELLMERPNLHDAELNRIMAWFHSVQDTNPKYLEPGDFVLAKSICEHLGYRVDDSIEQGAAQAQKEQP